MYLTIMHVACPIPYPFKVEHIQVLLLYFNPASRLKNFPYPTSRASILILFKELEKKP